MASIIAHVKKNCLKHSFDSDIDAICDYYYGMVNMCFSVFWVRILEEICNLCAENIRTWLYATVYSKVIINTAELGR